MYRPLVTLAAGILSAVVSPMTMRAQSAPSASAVHAALRGEWSGTLRYRDYQDSTRFVSLPTVLAGTLASDSGFVQRVQSEPLTLIVEMDGEDDDRKARIRETLTVE